MDITKSIGCCSKDYHYYRKHKAKKWGHKMSWTKATMRDVKGKLLKNIKKQIAIINILKL